MSIDPSSNDSAGDDKGQPPTDDAHADPDWFRAPSVREHRIAGALFVGFGVFFALLFVVQSGWWFRWVVLGLGVISALHGSRHLLDSRHATRKI